MRLWASYLLFLLRSVASSFSFRTHHTHAHTSTHAEHTLNEFRWSPRLVALNVSGASVVVDCRLFDFLLFAPPDFSRRALPIVALQTKRTTTPTMQMSGTGGKMRVVTIKLGYVSLYRLCRFRHFCRAFRILAVRWNFGIFSANFFWRIILLHMHFSFVLLNRCKTLLTNKL